MRPARSMEPSWNTLVAEHLAQFPIYVQSGVARKSPVTAFQRQPGIELHITHRGRGSFYLHDNFHVQEGRHLVVLSGDCAHQVFADTTSGYERSVVCFDRSILASLVPAGLDELLDAVPRPGEGRTLAVSARDWPTIHEPIERLNYEFFHQKRGWEAATYAGLLQLLVALGRLSADASPHRSESLPNQCIELIRQNLDQDLSLTTLAATLFVSPKHLSRTFSKSVGMTLSRYILHQRIRLAKSLLVEQEHLAISDVATRCGFKSPSHFSATFTRWAGVAPSTFRTQSRQSRQEQPGRRGY